MGLTITVYEGKSIAPTKRTAIHESYMDLVKQGCHVIVKPMSDLPNKKYK